jgi:hypothetical protein
MIGLYEWNPGQAVYYEIGEKSVDVTRNLIIRADDQSCSALTHGDDDRVTDKQLIRFSHKDGR